MEYLVLIDRDESQAIKREFVYCCLKYKKNKKKMKKKILGFILNNKDMLFYNDGISLSDKEVLAKVKKAGVFQSLMICFDIRVSNDEIEPMDYI